MQPTFTITAAAVSANPILDIVFLHGLGGSPSDSWEYKDKTNRVYWPSLLGQEFPLANVSVVGYPTAKLGKMLGGNDMGILTAAAGVVDLLSSHGIGSRPLFFIGHSLGGIVAKAVLRQCADSTDKRKHAVFEATKGVVFFGTPNTGASMGTVCSMIQNVTSMQAAEVARADTLLLELAQWFRSKSAPNLIRCHAFYETENLNGQIIVDMGSANPGVNGCDPSPLTSNHTEMCKIPSREHIAFKSVAAFIMDSCDQHKIEISTLPSSSPAQPAANAILVDSYKSTIFLAKDLRHLSVDQVDERDIFVEPVIYHENSKSRITSINKFIEQLLPSKAAVISGNDRSGKTLLTKLVQVAFHEAGRPAVRIDAKQLANADVTSFLGRAAKIQYGTNTPENSLTTVILDDFDECQLPDSLKEKMVSELVKNFHSIIVTSFTQAPSVLFTPGDRPDPDLFEISQLGDERLLQLVKKWRNLGKGNDGDRNDKADLAAFELLRKLYSQTELEKFPGSAVSFLQLIDSSTGNDINFSSYAACYETLITSHITKIRPNWQNLDEARNFIAYVAFTGHLQAHSPEISIDILNRCLNYYKDNFFSSIKDLRDIAINGFLNETENGYRFKEEYEWYFLCARHVANFLKSGVEYDNFVMECTSNIFSKQYANMIIFMAYFSTDNIILSLLLDTADGLFSKAPNWTLSDEQKTIMLGLTNTDQLAIQSSTDVSQNRVQILKERVISIIDDAEDMVAQYTLPFLNPDIGDSEYVQAIDPVSIGAESYMKSLNALMRVHSVIGQILASRSGTFDSKTMLDCIKRMVQASGRYIALNHAISAVLVFDRKASIEEVDHAYDSLTLTKDEKFDKVERIFSFWSVFISQAGLARYLSHDHAIRALKILAGKYEGMQQFKTGHIPFNFTSVLIIASLYKNEGLDRKIFEEAIDKYGDKSAIIPLLRVAVHFYSYYMPLSIQDKQWLGTKLKMPVKRIEAQRRKAIFAGTNISSAVVRREDASRRKRTKHKRQ